MHRALNIYDWLTWVKNSNVGKNNSTSGLSIIGYFYVQGTSQFYNDIEQIKQQQ